MQLYPIDNSTYPIITDQWKGYRPIAKDYTIEQIPSDYGMNFKALHTLIHQVKSWIRTTYSWVSKKHIDKYFSEFYYRINHSQSDSTIFNNLIIRMANSDKMYHAKIVFD
jgi:hypothetical protein